MEQGESQLPGEPGAARSSAPRDSVWPVWPVWFSGRAALLVYARFNVLPGELFRRFSVPPIRAGLQEWVGGRLRMLAGGQNPR